jgi:hypothetical protein
MKPVIFFSPPNFIRWLADRGCAFFDNTLMPMANSPPGGGDKVL